MQQSLINQSQSFSFVQLVHHKPNYNFYKPSSQVKHCQQYLYQPNHTLNNVQIMVRTIQSIKKDRIRSAFTAISSFEEVNQHPKEYLYHDQTIQQISSVEIINEQSNRSIQPQVIGAQHANQFIWQVATTKKVPPKILQDWPKKTNQRMPLSDCDHLINQPLIATRIFNTQNCSNCKYCIMLKQLKKKTYYLFN